MINKISPKIKTILLSTTVLSSLFTAHSAAFAAVRSFQITPPVVELSLSPGTVQESRVTVANLTDDLVALEAFVRDFVAGPHGDEPRILGEEETSSYSLKNWLLLSEKQFILSPRQEKTLTVTIVIPANAEPGGHYGLVGFTEPNSEIGEGVGVKAGIATLFFVTVDGPLSESGTIRRFAGPGLNLSGRIPLTLEIGNTGNVHYAPTGSIRITNLFGRQVADLPVNSDSRVLLPDSERSFSIMWQAGSAFSYYRAQATVKIGQAGATLVSPPTIIWVFPIRLVAIITLGLVILVLVGYEIEHLVALRRERREALA